jgi:hypothetical protein
MTAFNAPRFFGDQSEDCQPSNIAVVITVISPFGDQDIDQARCTATDIDN